LALFAVLVLFLAGNVLVASLISKLKNGKKRVAVNQQGALKNQLAQQAK
jgi:hypothetical protein